MPAAPPPRSVSGDSGHKHVLGAPWQARGTALSPCPKGEDGRSGRERERRTKCAGTWPWGAGRGLQDTWREGALPSTGARRRVGAWEEPGPQGERRPGRSTWVRWAERRGWGQPKWVERQPGRQPARQEKAQLERRCKETGGRQAEEACRCAPLPEGQSQRCQGPAGVQQRLWQRFLCRRVSRTHWDHSEHTLLKALYCITFGLVEVSFSSLLWTEVVTRHPQPCCSVCPTVGQE